MIARIKLAAYGLTPAMLVAFMLPSVARAQDKSKLDLEKIPKVVMQALKAKFPKAEIHKWTKEKEGDDIVYDIEFTQQRQKFEADIKEDGAIHNWEKEIAARDLPAAVKKAAAEKYPKAAIKEIMQITEVKDKKETLEGYEIVLETAEKKTAEITVAPNGKVMEDSGEAKEPQSSGKKWQYRRTK
jgi:Putative beta-lactamase-inhibitor-like, PepSY-like